MALFLLDGRYEYTIFNFCKFVVFSETQYPDLATDVVHKTEVISDGGTGSFWRDISK